MHAIDTAHSSIYVPGCNMKSQAVGRHIDPAKSHNPAMRLVVMVVKKVVEHVRKFPQAKVSLPCGLVS